MIIEVKSTSNLIPVSEITIARCGEYNRNDIYFINTGACKLTINGKEGPIPYFHIQGERFDTAICINANKYFPHGGKYENTLSRKDQEILYNWMNHINIKNPSMNNYQYICFIWNSLDNEGKATSNEIPDYIHMNGDFNPNYKRRGVTDDSLQL